MQKRIAVTLRCCNRDAEVDFSRRDAPGFPEGLYRTNLVCPACGTLLILTLQDSGEAQVVEQEQIAT